MNALIIEDDPKQADYLRTALDEIGIGSCVKRDGESGLATILAGGFDIVLLDIRLPKMNGIDVVQSAKESGNATPIILLTAQDALNTRCAGLDAGADDYVTKPFSKEVLLARIRAALRKDERRSEERLTLDGLLLDDGTHQVTLDGTEMKLTLTEYRILELLLRHPGRVFDRALIIDRISGGEKTVTERTIDVQMFGLRRKLGLWARHLETIRGVGYRLNEHGGAD